MALREITGYFPGLTNLQTISGSAQGEVPIYVDSYTYAFYYIDFAVGEQKSYNITVTGNEDLEFYARSDFMVTQY
jgi:hypothetical protein